MEETVQLVGNCILQISIPPGDPQGEGRQKGFHLRQSAHRIDFIFSHKQSLCSTSRMENVNLTE